MTVRSISFALLLFFFNNVMAQRIKPPERAIIYMKDGSKFLGDIVDRSDQSISLRMYNNSIFKIDLDKAERIIDSRNSLIYDNGKYHDTNGFYWGINYGFNADNILPDSDGRISNNLESFYGWRLNNKLSVSSGIGFEFHEVRIGGFNIDTQFLSFYLLGKYYITDTKYRIFSFARMGYGTAASADNFADDHTSGPQFQIGGGIKLPSRRRGKFTFSLGMHFQKTDGNESFIDGFGNEVRTKYDLWISRTLFKVGMEFN